MKISTCFQILTQKKTMNDFVGKQTTGAMQVRSWKITEARAIQFENGEVERLLRQRRIGEALPRKAVDEQQRREGQRMRAARPFNGEPRGKIVILDVQRAIRHSWSSERRNPNALKSQPIRSSERASEVIEKNWKAQRERERERFLSETNTHCECEIYNRKLWIVGEW